MSQSQALLRARLNSGASASCSGRPHLSPPPAPPAARRLSLARQDTAQQSLQQAAKRVCSGAALCVCAGATQCGCRGGSGCRSSRGVTLRCRARTRFDAEEEPSEEEDLDALVEDSAGGSLSQLCFRRLNLIASWKSFSAVAIDHCRVLTAGSCCEMICLLVCCRSVLRLPVAWQQPIP